MHVDVTSKAMETDLAGISSHQFIALDEACDPMGSDDSQQDAAHNDPQQDAAHNDAERLAIQDAAHNDAERSKISVARGL